MDKLWRSNSFVSSGTGCPPNIVNEENHNVEDNELFPIFQKWNIPKIDTKTVYKTSWTENAFHSAYKARIVEQIFSISKLMKNVACFLREILVNLLLLKNSVICIFVWFKLLLNHLLEKK